jgi:hypothetical protein
MKIDEDKAGRDGKSLVSGAAVFLAIVVYVNIRSGHIMTSIDGELLHSGGYF